MLYMQLLKALYGCIKSALLWYDLFSGMLVEMGFELNPYDNCVANKMINGKQCTIIWWVDDNCISQMSHSVLDMVIGKIENRFGKMKVTREEEHWRNYVTWSRSTQHHASQTKIKHQEHH